MATDDGEYEDNHSESEVSEEEENGENDQNVVGMGADDEELSEHWGVQWLIWNEFFSSQPSILTITLGHTQASSRRISYPKRRTPS